MSIQRRILHLLAVRPPKVLSTRLLLILLVGLLIRLDHFTEPWSDHFVPHGWSHMGWSGALYSTIARNYLRYGWATYLGPARSTGLVPADQLVFYAHHPPLLVWLIAMSFAVFGEHEWATRLVPLLFSLGSLLIMYALATRHFNRSVGLLATLLLAVVPMAAYYLGPFPDVHGPQVLFLMLLSLFWYFRWIESGKRGHFMGLALAVFGGILSDWPGFYVPLVITSYHSSTQSREKLPPLVILSAASMVLVLALIWYLGWLARDPLTIPGNFLTYSFAPKIEFLKTPSRLFTIILQWTTVAGKHILLFETPVILSLAISYIIVECSGVVRSRSPDRSHLVWMLFIIGLLHIVLGPWRAVIYEYGSMYLTPGLVLSAALWIAHLGDPRVGRSVGVRAVSILVSCGVGLLGLHLIVKSMDWRVLTGYFLGILLLGLTPFIPRRTVWRTWDSANVIIALGLACFILAAYGHTRLIWQWDNYRGLGAYHAAKILRERTTAAEEILAGPSIAWWQNVPFTYYADRPFIRVDTVESLAARQTERRFRYLILSKKEMDKDLAAYTAIRFYTESYYGYLLVDLRRPL